MTIGILNAYNAANLGDQAIVQCILSWCKRSFPGADILIFSNHHEANREIFGDKSARPPAWLNPNGSAIERLLRPIWEMVLFHLGRQSPERSQFEKCDLYILCGGGYLYSSKAPLFSRNLLLMCWLGIVAAGRKPTILFPQSIGPLTKIIDKLAVRILCNRARLLMPRSELSLETLERWGLADKSRLVPDIVLAMRELCADLYPSPEPVRSGLGISAINLDFVPGIGAETKEKYSQELIEVAEAFYHKTGEPVRLFVQVGIAQYDDDREAVIPIWKKLQSLGVPAEIIDTGRNVEEYMRHMSCNRLLIGCRMHACIFSLTTGTPTIGLAYQPKFVGTFLSLGLEDWVTPINNADKKWILDRMEDALKNETSLREKISSNVKAVGKNILSKLDQAIPLGRPFVYAQNDKHPLLTVVTPSHRQINWLTLCSASVIDQSLPKGQFVEHLIQDTGSPGIDEFAISKGTHCIKNGIREDLDASGQNRIVIFCENDNGMYDAINRGFQKSTGDILCWLNCDEQFLPGTLAKVARFFETQPNVDVLFGDALLVATSGEILSYRKAVIPSVLHTQLSHLNTLSCATFVRRRVLESGHFLKSDWKAIADAIWITDLQKHGFRMAAYPEPLSIFTITDENLGQTSLAYHEMLRWRKQASAFLPLLRPFVIASHRLQKFLSGAYRKRAVSASLYTISNPDIRTTFHTKRAPFGWPKTSHAASSSPQDWKSHIRSIVRLVLPGVALPTLASLLFQAIDQRVSEVAITPFLSLAFLFALALFFRPVVVALAALVLAVGALNSFLAFRNILPHETAALIYVAVRFSSFATASTIAVLLSYSKYRTTEALNATETLLSEIPAPVIVSDSSGTVIRVNREARSALRSGDTPMGKKWPLLMLANQDEGSATRAYIDFFAGEDTRAKDITLHLRHSPDAPTRARIICLGRGSDRVMITVIEDR